MADEHEQTGLLMRHKVDSLTARIRAACLQKGWSVGELVRRAGISRTTLFNLQRGLTRSPQTRTLAGIAAALEMDAEELCDLRFEAPGRSVGLRNGLPVQTGDEQRRRAFDRCTNSVIAYVYRERPDLFFRWSDSEWDELYSIFGTGGELTEQGVVETARRMNQRRETVHHLRVVLETHLAPVAEQMIETLYRMVRPGNNLCGTPEPATLSDPQRSQNRRQPEQVDEFRPS